jgi:tetratricopeptide (TPR) repeat protein
VEGIRANIRARLAAEGDLAGEADIPKTPFEKALADEESGEVERAMEKYWDIISRDPYHVPAFDHLGTLYLRRGEKKQAADIFKRGLKKNPDSLPLLDDLAETHYQLGETGEYHRLKRRIGELRGSRPGDSKP